MEVYVDDETKLTLHGLQQHYVKLQDKEKNRKLFDLLDVLEFNQVRTLVENVSSVRAFKIDDHLPFTLLGDHLCEVCPTLHCPGPIAGGAELPCNLHPQRDAPGREVSGVRYLEVPS